MIQQKEEGKRKKEEVAVTLSSITSSCNDIVFVGATLVVARLFAFV